MRLFRAIVLSYGTTHPVRADCGSVAPPGMCPSTARRIFTLSRGRSASRSGGRSPASCFPAFWPYSCFCGGAFPATKQNASGHARPSVRRRPAPRRRTAARSSVMAKPDWADTRLSRSWLDVPAPASMTLALGAKGSVGAMRMGYLVGSDAQPRIAPDGTDIDTVGNTDLFLLRTRDPKGYGRIHVTPGYFRQHVRYDLAGFDLLLNLVTDADQNPKVLANLVKLLRRYRGRGINRPERSEER